MQSAAIIGAGPGGLASARWLSQWGFEPAIFEQGDRLGGQWTRDPRYSGVWPSLRTNTCRYLTAFGDLPFPHGGTVFPTNEAVREYLEHYAQRFDLDRRVQLGTRVEALELRRDGRWQVGVVGSDGRRREEIHSRVVVASGRYHKPSIPAIPGLASFSGRGGVVHTFEYRGADRFRGLRVLVAGCSISSLEIASDLAMGGAARVVSSNRRQRYILQKLLAGVSTDLVAFTRFAALAAESLPPEATAQAFLQFITRTSGTPERFGAPRPPQDVFEAGIAVAQHYLPLVAEGRIDVTPWIAGVEGSRVTFADGRSEHFDAIVLGTGYTPELPFLAENLRSRIIRDGCMDLFKFTFHPDAPGLAFVGMVQSIGPAFPLEELQARWAAYTWSGVAPEIPPGEMAREIEAARARARGRPIDHPLMHTAAVAIARAAGIEPELERWPQLARALLFGPLTAMSFRLSGPDSLPDAAERVAADAAESGAVPTPELTPEQCAQLRTLAAARHDPIFLSFVERLMAPPAAAA